MCGVFREKGKVLVGNEPFLAVYAAEQATGPAGAMQCGACVTTTQVAEHPGCEL